MSNQLFERAERAMQASEDLSARTRTLIGTRQLEADLAIAEVRLTRLLTHDLAAAGESHGTLFATLAAYARTRSDRRERRSRPRRAVARAARAGHRNG